VPEPTTWWQIVHAGFKKHGVKLVAHVPDAVLTPLILALEADPEIDVVPLTREEEGVGILSGAYLGGMRGALLMQSSGLGNTINALGGLPMAYHFPFLIVISPRGRLSEFNPAQVPAGRAAPRLLDALGIEAIEMTRLDEVEKQLDAAARSCFSTELPWALVVSPLLSGGKVVAQR
jgi:sulfopyruvate decarboxylase alpha subunit